MTAAAHNKFDDIQDRAVLDLGCGTCMLSTAAKILGAGYVCGVDVDGDALEIAQRNVDLSLPTAACERAKPPALCPHPLLLFAG
jgi:predicted RNA methylase